MPVVRYNPANVTTQPMNAQTSLKTTPETFTGGIEKTISKAAEVYAQEIDRADDARVLKAKQELSAAANDFLNNNETGVLNARGENAFNSRERYANEFSPVVDRIKNSLNERQRAKFNPYEFDITQNMNKNIESHVAKERYVVDEANTKAFLLNEQQAAVYSYTDFGEIEKSVERQKNEIKAMAARNGLPTEAAANQAMGAESRTRSIVIEQLVNSNNAQSAKLYLESNKKRMLPADVLRLEKLVKDGADMQTAQDTADKIISTHYADPKAAINAANKAFKDDVKMRDDVKQRVFLHFDEQEKADRLKKEDNVLYGINLAAVNRGKPIQDLVPKEMWSSFNEKQKQNLIDFARYGYPNQDNYDDLYKLKLMAANPQTKNDFMQEDLRSYTSKLTQSSLNSLVALQHEMRDGNGGNELKDLQSQMGIIDDSLRQQKYNLKSKRPQDIEDMNQFRAAVERERRIWLEANGKKIIPNEELRAITTRLAADVIIGKGLFGRVKTTPVFQTDPESQNISVRFSDIPKSEVNIIKKTLRNNGIEPTEDAILTRYRQRLDIILGVNNGN